MKPLSLEFLNQVKIEILKNVTVIEGDLEVVLPAGTPSQRSLTQQLSSSNEFSNSSFQGFNIFNN